MDFYKLVLQEEIKVGGKSLDTKEDKEDDSDYTKDSPEPADDTKEDPTTNTTAAPDDTATEPNTDDNADDDYTKDSPEPADEPADDPTATDTNPPTDNTETQPDNTGDTQPTGDDNNVDTTGGQETPDDGMEDDTADDDYTTDSPDAPDDTEEDPTTTDTGDTPADDTTGTGDATGDDSNGGTGEEDDDFTTDSPEGADDTGEEDVGDGEDGSGGNMTDDEIKQLETDLFSNLTPEQIAIKQTELKTQFITLYTNIEKAIDRLSKVNRLEDTIRPIEFVTQKLLDLKDLVSSSLTESFDTRSYVENQIILQRHMAVFATLTKILEELGKPKDKEDKE